MDEKKGHQRREYTRNRPLGRDRYGNEYWRFGGDTRLVLVRRHGCWWGLYDGPAKVFACARCFVRVAFDLIVVLVAGAKGIGRGTELRTDMDKAGCLMVEFAPVKKSDLEFVRERRYNRAVVRA